MTRGQPTTVGGDMYAQIEFETDVPASELTTCSPSTPSGCAVPPPNGPGHFYPFWTQAMVGRQCVWEFGQFDLSSPPRKNPQCT